jgi:hypothetical protein
VFWFCRTLVTLQGVLVLWDSGNYTGCSGFVRIVVTIQGVLVLWDSGNYTGCSGFV